MLSLDTRCPHQIQPSLLRYNSTSGTTQHPQAKTPSIGLSCFLWTHGTLHRSKYPFWAQVVLLRSKLSSLGTSCPSRNRLVSLNPTDPLHALAALCKYKLSSTDTSCPPWAQVAVPGEWSSSQVASRSPWEQASSPWVQDAFPIHKLCSLDKIGLPRHKLLSRHKLSLPSLGLLHRIAPQGHHYICSCPTRPPHIMLHDQNTRLLSRATTTSMFGLQGHHTLL